MSEDFKARLADLTQRLQTVSQRAENEVAVGTSKAQACRLTALVLINGMKLEEFLNKLEQAANWAHDSVQLAEQESRAEGNLQVAMDKYSASLTGRMPPIYTRSDFDRVWTAMTKTKGEVVEPYFELLLEVGFPIVEAHVQQVEKLLADADAA